MVIKYLPPGPPGVSPFFPIIVLFRKMNNKNSNKKKTAVFPGFPEVF